MHIPCCAVGSKPSPETARMMHHFGRMLLGCLTSITFVLSSKQGGCDLLLLWIVSLCLSVCLSVSAKEFFKTLWMDVCEIWKRVSPWHWKQLLKCWGFPSKIGVSSFNFWFCSYLKGWRLPILVTKRWARTWSTVSQWVSISHPPSGRLPLFSARPAVTFPAAEHHCPLAGIKLYCLVTEAHKCDYLAKVVN